MVISWNRGHKIRNYNNPESEHTWPTTSNPLQIHLAVTHTSKPNRPITGDTIQKYHNPQIKTS
jgi:hypothetical protein